MPKPNYAKMHNFIEKLQKSPSAGCASGFWWFKFRAPSSPRTNLLHSHL